MLSYPAPAKASGHTEKWAAKGKQGTVAGYGIETGHHWRGAYMVWDLTDFDGVDLTATNKALPRKLAAPHLTEVLALPEGPLVFPLQAEYNRLNYTFEGRREHLERAETNHR